MASLISHTVEYDLSFLRIHYFLAKIVSVQSMSYNVLVPLKYLQRLKLETSNFVHWLAMSSISLRIGKIMDNISEMVQGTDIITMEEIVHGLSNGIIFSALE